MSVIWLVVAPQGLSISPLSEMLARLDLAAAKLAPQMVMPLDRTDNTGLAGATEDLLQCMADASTGKEIESCELAYDATFEELEEKNRKFGI